MKGISDSSLMFCFMFYGLRRGILRLVVSRSANDRKCNLLRVGTQSHARSRSHSHKGIYPDDGGSRCESGPDQIGQLSIPQGITNPSFASIPHIYERQPAPTLGPSTHSQLIL